MNIVNLFWMGAIGALVLVGVAPSGRTQQSETNSGQSESGKISWELRSLADNNSIEETVWIWPKGLPDQAVSLGQVDHFSGVHFSSDDSWILIGDGLSDGSFITVYQRKAGFEYSPDEIHSPDDIQSSIAVAALTPHRRAGQKIDDLIDRDSVFFKGWAPEYGKYAFFVGFYARMSEKGPDRHFLRFLGWKGVYDLQKGAVVKILNRGKIETDSDLSDQDLNQVYGELRGLLDAKGKERLKIEEEAWLKKRDAITDPEEKLSFVMERIEALQSQVDQDKAKN
jgi:Lysozyme inhibitor LprI